MQCAPIWFENKASRNTPLGSQMRPEPSGQDPSDCNSLSLDHGIPPYLAMCADAGPRIVSLASPIFEAPSAAITGADLCSGIAVQIGTRND
jgi:hypothetical protein